jgi:hypothetical protein
VGFGGVPITPVVQRYFTEISAAGGQYYQLDTPLDGSGDFELEIIFSRSIATGGAFILYNYDELLGSYGISLYSTGDYGIGAGTLSLFGTGVAAIGGLQIDLMYTVTFKVSGGIVTSYLNKVQKATAPFSRPAGYAASTIGRIGRNNGSGFKFTGVVGGIKFWSGGDRSTGALVLDAPLDGNGVAGSVGATAYNITQDDSELFSMNSSGNWVNDGWPNLVSMTRNLGDPVWGFSQLSGNVTPNYSLAPDGTLTGVRLESISGRVQRSLPSSVLDGTLKSIYAKSNSGTGTIALLGHNSLSKYQVTLTDEWQRFDFIVDRSEAYAHNLYLADFRYGTLDDISLWGAQFEDAVTSTTFVPTDDKGGKILRVFK